MAMALIFQWIFLSQVLSVSSFKMGHFCDMFNWRMTEGYAYWPLWARQTGSMLQLIPILLIPAVGLIQCVRYLSSGPSDLFDVRWGEKTKKKQNNSLDLTFDFNF